MLAARACVFSGSGLITVATHPTNHSALHSRCPEAMVIDINDTKMLTKMIEMTTYTNWSRSWCCIPKEIMPLHSYCTKYTTASKFNCRRRCDYNL